MRKEWIKQYKSAGFDENEAIAETDFAIEVVSSITRTDLLKGANTNIYSNYKMIILFVGFVKSTYLLIYD